MPIKIGPDDKSENIRPGTDEAELLKFLYRHRGWAYSRRELLTEIEMSYASVHKALSRLSKKGLIGEIDGHYHALEVDDIARRVASLHSLDAISDDLSDDEPFTRDEVDALPDMPFRPDPERYGGYDREEALRRSELPPDRKPRGEVDEE
ncbi:hypothetical protein ACFQH6_15020 [Halobacteriaceae archaeon GCM10025711]